MCKYSQNVIAELNMKDFVVCYGMTETSPVSFQVHTVLFTVKDKFRRILLSVTDDAITKLYAS